MRPRSRLLRDAAERLRLSARGYHRVLKLARTLADLDGGGPIAAGAFRRSAELSRRSPSAPPRLELAESAADRPIARNFATAGQPPPETMAAVAVRGGPATGISR